jgi:hypothetical protein
MVKGAKIAKRSGHIQVLNAVLNKTGLINHHTRRASLGPKNARTVSAQHIMASFLHEKAFCNNTLKYVKKKIIKIKYFIKQRTYSYSKHSGYNNILSFKYYNNVK